ncbi:MAG: GAF domain-containing protein [Clostridia bacterium]|nr:GAF domain-containing protein [Clostridia bacterium]
MYQRNEQSTLFDLPDLMRGLLSGETDEIAVMAHASALIYDLVPDLNWAGFYRLLPNGELILGPFQGKPACVRIKAGRGVCGKAVESGEPLVVPDVHAFPDHIACDSASASEMVVPLRRKDGTVFGVLDLDSATPARFAPIREIILATAKVIEEAVG